MGGPWSFGTSTCCGGECCHGGRELEGSGWVNGGGGGEGGVCSITSALMTSPEFKVGRATDRRRAEERGGRWRSLSERSTPARFC